MTDPQTYPGRYNDGRTARAQAATVLITSAGLTILDQHGTQLAVWPPRDVRYTTAEQASDIIHLQCADLRGRLTIDDTTARAALTAACPNLTKNLTTTRREWRKIAAWAATAVAAVAIILFVIVPIGAAWFATRLPPGVEARLGRQTADQLISLFARLQQRTAADFVCTGEPGLTVLEQLTVRLAASAGTDFPVELTVIDHPIANAFALPGGQIVLFRGLIDLADNGEQVVGVIAHEVGHVQLHHPTEVALKNAAGVGLIGLLVGDFGGAAAIAATAQALIAASYTREAEQQADEAAVAILNDQGISAEPLAAFFADLAEQLPIEVPEYLSSHPADTNRAATLRSLGTARGRAMTDADWRAVQQICG